MMYHLHPANIKVPKNMFHEDEFFELLSLTSNLMLLYISKTALTELPSTLQVANFRQVLSNRLYIFEI